MSSSGLVGGFVLFGVETNTWGTALEQLQTGLNLPLWGGALTTMAAAWWLSAIFLRRYGAKVRKVDNPQRLFRDLVRAQRLSWTESALLEQLAEARGLADPALLFVRDDYCTVHDLNDEICEHGPAIEKLREKLFASAERESGTAAAESTGAA